MCVEWVLQRLGVRRSVGLTVREAGVCEATSESVRTKTVRIRWQEISDHEAVLRVVFDFDRDNRDLENGLAELEDWAAYRFLGVEREVIEVSDVEDDPDAEFFDPPTYRD